MINTSITNKPTSIDWFIPLIILPLWFMGIAHLAKIGVFESEIETVPIYLIAAMILPAILFLLAWYIIPAVKAWTIRLDMTVIVGLQITRVMGIVFLFVWAMGNLPFSFAIPAGIGDIAVGFFAIWAMLATERKTKHARRLGFMLIIFGLLDFVMAVGTAQLSDFGRLLDFSNSVQPDLMQSSPMTLIPTFFVPVYIVLHLIAFLKLTNDRSDKLSA